ncbi:MAG: hypothetical protein FWC80_05070 [Firmicutes bacterium]|nr:hypothetical protein [Bacillota bacterium]
MSKRYEGCNFVDVVVTPLEVKQKTKKTNLKIPAPWLITIAMCVMVFGVWLGRALEIPFFYTAGHHMRQAISFDVVPSEMRGDGDGKLQFIADLFENAGVMI